MKFRLLDVLQSPQGGDLKLKEATISEARNANPPEKVPCQHFCAFKQVPLEGSEISITDCQACYKREISEGKLVSARGETFPIVRAIPRFVQSEIPQDIRKIQKTFSSEWDHYVYGQRNWGQTIEYRKQLFLQCMGSSPEELKGKTIWDAGCGSGILATEMSRTFGMEVIALDLAFGIDKAQEFCDQSNVHFVQGSVLSPPLRKRYFDYLYCAGVLVACPDTYEGFKSIIPQLKEGGRCFIWVYQPVNKEYMPHDWRKVSVYNWIRTNVTSKLPIPVQRGLYWSWIPFFLVKQECDILTGRLERANRRTAKEKMQALFDAFSPIFQHKHTYEEVEQWYQDEGFINFKISEKGLWGFGAYGDLPKSDITATGDGSRPVEMIKS